jgi:hypothetical protein
MTAAIGRRGFFSRKTAQSLPRDIRGFTTFHVVTGIHHEVYPDSEVGDQEEVTLHAVFFHFILPPSSFILSPCDRHPLDALSRVES